MKYLLAFLTFLTIPLNAYQEDIIDLYLDCICEKKYQKSSMEICFEFEGKTYIVDDFHEQDFSFSSMKIESVYEVPNSRIFIYELSYYNN